MSPRIELDPYEPRPGGDFFGPDSDWWHNAVVSEFHSSWYIYAEGYREAADHLVDAAAEDRGRNDFLVYPIVFLYRQYLELSFKGMTRDAAWLKGAGPQQFGTHSLAAIWTRLKPLLRDALLDVGEVEWQILTNCVKQFAQCDPTSETFRYPEKTDGSPAQHAVTHINLRQLRKEMKNAHAVIDSIWNYLVVLTDLENDIRRDAYP